MLPSVVSAGGGELDRGLLQGSQVTELLFESDCRLLGQFVALSDGNDSENIRQFGTDLSRSHFCLSHRTVVVRLS